jgi:hypothetical protein
MFFYIFLCIARKGDTLENIKRKAKINGYKRLHITNKKQSTNRYIRWG